MATSDDSSALSALADLLSNHRGALLDVFTRLGTAGSTPRAVVDARLRELQSDLVGAVQAQRERAQGELDAVARDIDGVREAGKRMRRELGEPETASTLIDAGGEVR